MGASLSLQDVASCLLATVTILWFLLPQGNLSPSRLGPETTAQCPGPQFARPRSRGGWKSASCSSELMRKGQCPGRLRGAHLWARGGAAGGTATARIDLFGGGSVTLGLMSPGDLESYPSSSVWSWARVLRLLSPRGVRASVGRERSRKQALCSNVYPQCPRSPRNSPAKLVTGVSCCFADSYPQPVDCLPSLVVGQQPLTEARPGASQTDACLRMDVNIWRCL